MILALSMICKINTITPIRVMTNQIYIFDSRQFSAASILYIYNIKKSISDLIDVTIVKVIAFANTYSFLEKIDLKLRNTPIKSHRGQKAK